MRRRLATLAAAAALAAGACKGDPTVFLPLEDDGGTTDGAIPIDAPPEGIHVQVTPATTTVSEGGQTTVQVRLSEAPPETRTIDVVGSLVLTATPSQLTFSPDTWSVNRTVILTAGQDDDAADSPVAVVFDGRGFVGDGSALVMITDDDELGLVVTPPVSVGVTEGSTAAVSVQLSARPTSNVVIAVTTADPARATASPPQLTFTEATWNQAQPVTVAGTGDADTADTMTDLVLDPELDGMATRTIAVAVTDSNVLALDASPTNLGVLTEAAGPSHSGTISLRLTQAPPGVLTVTLAAVPGDAVSLSPSQVTFTALDYAVPRSITVTALTDDDATDEQVAIRLTAPGVTDRVVQATVADDDVQVITVTPEVVPVVAEGATTDLGVRLAFRPSTTVLVDVQSDDPSIAAVDRAQLTFTPADYDVVQTVRVTGVDDANLADGTAIISFNAAAAGLTTTRPITVDDGDVQDLIVSTQMLAVPEGGQRTFTVRLLFEPAGNVMVTAGTTATGDVSVSPAMMTFTPLNYDTPQTVTVAGLQDADTTGEVATVTVASTGVPSRAVTVDVSDDDTLDIRVTPATLALNEGAAGQPLMVSLGAAPAGNVVVSVSATPAGVVSLGTTSMTFTPGNYMTPQPVVVTAVNDADGADGSATVRLTGSGLADKTVPVSVNDDDNITPVLTPSPITVTEGTPDSTLRLRLSDDPGGTVTVNVTSSAGVSVTPSSYTFTSSNWNTGQAVTLTTFGDDTADDEVETATFTIAGQASAMLTINVDDPTILIGFTGPHDGVAYEPELLAAYQTGPMPSCFAIDKIAMVLTEAGTNAKAQFGLYDQFDGEPARAVWQSQAFLLGLGTGLRILDIGDVVVEPVNPGNAWIAVDTSNMITFAARSGTVPTCERVHDYATPLPDPFDTGGQGSPTCGMQSPLAIWLIARAATGCN